MMSVVYCGIDFLLPFCKVLIVLLISDSTLLDKPMQGGFIAIAGMWSVRSLFYPKGLAICCY